MSLYVPISPCAAAFPIKKSKATIKQIGFFMGFFQIKSGSKLRNYFGEEQPPKRSNAVYAQDLRYKNNSAI